MTLSIDAIMRMAPVVPVLVLDDGLDPIALAASARCRSGDGKRERSDRRRGDRGQ